MFDGTNGVEINDIFIQNYKVDRTDLDMYYEKVGLMVRLLVEKFNQIILCQDLTSNLRLMNSVLLDQLVVV